MRLEGRASPELTQVEEVAVARARQAAGRVTAEVLRHACHEVALGRDKSSKDFTTAECNRVVALLDLLADPLDLAARVRLDHPERAEADALAAALRRFPAAYVGAVSADKFGTRNWASLALPQMRMLHVTLRSRFRCGASR